MKPISRSTAEEMNSRVNSLFKNFTIESEEDVESLKVSIHCLLSEYGLNEIPVVLRPRKDPWGNPGMDMVIAVPINLIRPDSEFDEKGDIIPPKYDVDVSIDHN